MFKEPRLRSCVIREGRERERASPSQGLLFLIHNSLARSPARPPSCGHGHGDERIRDGDGHVGALQPAGPGAIHLLLRAPCWCSDLLLAAANEVCSRFEAQAGALLHVGGGPGQRAGQCGRRTGAAQSQAQSRGHHAGDRGAYANRFPTRWAVGFLNSISSVPAFVDSWGWLVEFSHCVTGERIPKTLHALPNSPFYCVANSVSTPLVPKCCSHVGYIRVSTNARATRGDMKYQYRFCVLDH